MDTDPTRTPAAMDPATALRMFENGNSGIFDPVPEHGDWVRMAMVNTPLGLMLAGADSEVLRFLDFADRNTIVAQIAALRETSGMRLAPGDNPVLGVLRRELGQYFEGRLTMFSVPVEAPGTPFQRTVWAFLRTIPYGATVSYGEVAAAVGSPGASRAVGTANGRNRIAIVVPCHRVVNADGSTGGYGGGVERKTRLLALERQTGT